MTDETTALTEDETSGAVHLAATEPKCEGLAPFRCGNPSCPAHSKEADNA